MKRKKSKLFDVLLIDICLTMNLEVRRKVKKDAPMSIVCQFHCIAKLIRISKRIYIMEESRNRVLIRIIESNKRILTP